LKSAGSFTRRPLSTFVSLTAIERIEVIVGILLSLAILVLLISRAKYAGGLWRDECAALQLARMPGVKDIAENFQHEAFPLFFPAIIRAFTRFFGTTDIALRCFGFGVGVALICVAWFNAWSLNRATPLLFLALVGLNPNFLVWGTSIRGYGLGSVFIVLAFGLIGKLLLDPSPVRIIAATMVSLASVQFLLHNAALLFAIGVSAAFVCFVRRDFKRAGIILGIGLVSAISLLPYLKPYVSGNSWNVVVKSTVSVTRIWHQLNLALGSAAPIMAVAWHILFAVLIAAAMWRLYATKKDGPASQWDILLFVVLTLFTTLAAYYSFLQVLSYVPQPWYFVALISVLGMGADLLVGALPKWRWLRLGRLAFATVALIGLPIADWSQITQRQTNIDIVAHELEHAADPSDLIVVSPWQFGIPFSWYYHASTRWVTLPAISDHRIHRYDLIKNKMMSSKPIDDVIDLIGGSLRSGHRVWLVGGIQFPKPAQAPLSLPPAPNSNFGWDNVAYMAAWDQQMGAFIRNHALRGSPVSLPAPNIINPLESVPLFVVEGWKE
jgi:hypothetical protein